MVVELPDGRVLAADDVGDPAGRVVVYLHGTPDSRLARHPDDGVAAALGVRLIAVDRPGFGASSSHPTGTYGSFADDVAHLAGQLGIAHLAVLGWSAGALPALAIAARHPSLVTGAGVAAGLPPFSAYGESGLLDDADGGRHALAEIGAALGPAGTAAELAPYLVPEGVTLDLAREHVLEGADPVRRAELESVPGAVEQMAEALVEAVRMGRLGLAHDLVLQVAPPDVDLASVQCPVRLWYGTLDATAPPSFGRWYAEHLPDARLVVLGGAGHCFPLPRWADLLTAVAVGR